MKKGVYGKKVICPVCGLKAYKGGTARVDGGVFRFYMHGNRKQVRFCRALEVAK